MNSCTFYGNLGKDPERKEGKKGDLVVFSVAVRRGSEEEPLWINCAIFSEGLGEVALKYLVKGNPVVVSGEINLFEGKETASLQLNVRQLSLVSTGGDDRKSKSESRGRRDDDDRGRRRGDDDDRRERRSSRDDRDTKSSRKTYEKDLDDEIPF